LNLFGYFHNNELRSIRNIDLLTPSSVFIIGSKLLKGRRIVILGAGFGGLASANILRKNLSQDHQITVIDKKDYFFMGFVNLWILNGDRQFEESKIALNNLENKGISFIHDDIIAINPIERNITTARHNHKHEYEYLIIALGAEYASEEIDGFVKNHGFNLYDVEHIPNMRKEILALKQGRIAVTITSFPYKCPPAPFEASLLINNILLKNRTRDNIDIDIYTPSQTPLPVAGQKVNRDLSILLEKNHIHFHPFYKLNSVSSKRSLEFEIDDDKKENVDYDLLIAIPPHRVPSVVKQSHFINNGQNWIDVNKFTLKTKYENVFAIGDVTEIKVNQKVSIPKAGIFAEGQAKAACQHIIDDIKNQSNNPKFDGKGFCFMEVGDKKAGYINTDFYNLDGPITNLEPPSEESYRKKIDFEKNRLNDWLKSLQ
jgi:sulfide:quinone oxidoreductase